MFQNIGRKFQFTAFVTVYLGIIASFICALSIWVAAGLEGFLPGLLVLILGSGAAYIGSWGIFAFGSMVENLQIIANAVKNLSEPLPLSAGRHTAKSSDY